MRRSEPPFVRRNEVDAGAAQGGEARRGGAVQRADAVLLIHTLAGTGNQTHTHHPISMDLGLALPKAAVFMSGPEMRRAFRRVPPALRLRSGREIFKRPVREGGFAGRQKIEQNKNFVQFGGEPNRSGARFRPPARPTPPSSRSGGGAEYLPAS